MEPVTRAEQYYNYALQNQDAFPKPITRLETYMLALADEVRTSQGSSSSGTGSSVTFCSATDDEINAWVDAIQN